MTLLGNIYAIIAILMWGTLALLAKEANDVPPFLLLALCFSIAALIMPLLNNVRGTRYLVKPSFHRIDAVIGIGCLFGFHACYFIALKYAPVIEVSLIGYLWPMLLALLVAKQGMKLQSLVGGCIGILAVSIVLGWENINFNSDYFIGYLLALWCAIIWAFYSWYLSQNKTSSNHMSWQCVGVALIALIISMSVESWSFEFSWRLLLAITLLGLGPIGGAFYLWDAGLKHGNKSLISSLSFATPLLSALFLAIFNYVNWSNSLVTSLALLILASVIINFKHDGIQTDEAVE